MTGGLWSAALIRWVTWMAQLLFLKKKKGLKNGVYSDITLVTILVPTM